MHIAWMKADSRFRTSLGRAHHFQTSQLSKTYAAVCSAVAAAFPYYPFSAVQSSPDSLCVMQCCDSVINQSMSSSNS